MKTASSKIGHFITVDPHILGGKRVIVGTRIPIARILFLLKEGYTIESIAQEYPHVKKAFIEGAVNELIKNLDQYTNAPQVL